MRLSSRLSAPTGPVPIPILVITAVICLLSIAAALSLGLAARAAAMRDATREMAALLDELAHRIEADVAVFDLALRDAPASGHAAHRPPPGHALIARYVTFIDVLNETGDVIASGRGDPPKPANYAGRDYFQDQLKTPGGALAIGRPFGLAPNQVPALPLSRRLTTANGAFAGVVVAGIRLSWLRDMLPGTGPGSTLSVSVRRDDGQLLMRTPFDPGETGRPPTAGPEWTAWHGTGAAPPGDDQSGARLLRRLDSVALVLDGTVARPATPLVTWLAVISLVPVLCALRLGLLAMAARRHAGTVEAAARDANEERMRLLATMSHELRTPLTGLLGQAELLRDEGTLTPRQITRLARLSEAGRLMRDIVDRVIDVARPEDPAAKPELTLCGLDALVIACRGMVESEARKKGLHLTSYVAPAVPRFPMLARDLVQQVLVNLLMNAVKYTAAGSVELRALDGAAVLRFEVADTGRGIPAAKRNRLFTAYDRLDEAPNTAEGTGLGLSLTEGFVRRMGGRIGHRDNAGGGSVFWVELPLTPAPALARIAPDHPPGPPAQKPALRVLLADDLDVTRSVTADFLRAAGHWVTEVRDGEEAIAEAASREYDVILTDMRMPVVDGLEATRRIRALPGHHGQTPVVLVTADPAARGRAAPGPSGADFCLMKPFTRKELLEAVETAARLMPAIGPDIGPDILTGEAPAGLSPHPREPAIVEAAMRRLRDLLDLLDQPGAGVSPKLRDTAHDLTGMAGLMGLTRLGSELRRFNESADETAAPGLRDAAVAALCLLRDHHHDQTVPGHAV